MKENKDLEVQRLKTKFELNSDKDAALLRSAIKRAVKNIKNGSIPKPFKNDQQPG